VSEPETREIARRIVDELEQAANYARRMQADDGTPWWQKLIDQTSE
jgi:hypothetical protein